VAADIEVDSMTIYSLPGLKPATDGAKIKFVIKGKSVRQDVGRGVQRGM
jgi:hypothetical protein